MSLQPSAHANAPVAGELTVFSLATDRHLAALSRLNQAFDEQQPVALMIGECPHEFSHVIGAFLTGLDDSVTYVRLQQPQDDALAAMREISRSLGFEPNDLSVSDLQSVLTMFLEFQSKHRRRTVISVEKADEQALWLLDCIAGLVGIEQSGRPGLMIVLSGGDELDGLLRRSSLEILRLMAGQPIRLAPFTLNETREFVRQRSDASGRGDLQSLFDFDAVERLHMLSGGIPHVVAKLCQECLVIVEHSESDKITGKIVVKAARLLRLNSGLNLAMEVVGNSPDAECLELSEQWLIRRDGRLLQRIPFRRGRFIVGRSKSADICLPGSAVSRRHALIISTSERLEVLDLGSTNGTFVDGFKVTKQVLGPGAVLKIGDCEIEYDLS